MTKRRLAIYIRRLIALCLCGLTMAAVRVPTAHADGDGSSTIRVGYFAFEGYHEIDENGLRSGYGYDFLTLMKRYADVNYEYVGYEKSWSDMQRMLLDGEIDMVTSAHKTAEREELFDFSLPIGTNTIELNVRADDDRYTAGDHSAYNGMTIGLIEGSSSNADVERYAQENGFAFTPSYYASTDELKAALAAGAVDAIATSSLRRSENERTIAEFDMEYFYAIVRKGDTELLARIDSAILAMNASEANWKSTLFYNNYEAHNHIGLSFSEAERAYIRAHSEGGERITIAYDNRWEPFTYREDDHYTGILPDLWDHIMQMTGMVYEVYDSGNDIIDENDILEGKADIYMGYCFDAATSETNGFVESSAFMSAGAAMLTRKGNDRQETIGISAINPRLNSLLSLEDGQRTVLYGSSAAALQALENGEIDAVFLYAYEGEMLVNRDTTGLLVYRGIPDLELELCAVAPEKESHVLIGIVSKCINAMATSEMNTIIARNLTVGTSDLSIWDQIRLHPAEAAAAAAGLAALVLGLIFIALKNRAERKHSRALQEKVTEITALNTRLEESSAEQEAQLEEQLEEIKALNSELEQRQAQMEESAAEQEAQIEEINALNAQLTADGDTIQELNGKYRQNLDIVARTGYGIWRIRMRPDGNHRMVADETLQRIFGISDMGLSPEALYTYYHGRLIDDVSDIEQNDYAKMRDGALKSRTLQWQHPEKGVILLRAGGTCYGEDADGTIISGYCADVTEQTRELEALNRQLKAAAEQAEAANRSKSSFLFSMSHDIRTPMNAIIGYANLIKKHSDDRERCLDYLDKIIGSGDFLLDLINNVLEMARIESGREVLDETTWNVADFNNSLFAVFEEEMRRKGINYTRTVDIRNEYVFCDSVKVREIFLNLLSNALKYTPAGGTVRMELKELPSDREGYALMQTTVADTGIGMSAEYLPHLFEEFTRAESATQNGIQGTGLGMPIVRKLVDLMGGTIEVESELGKGTTFVVRLYHRLSSAEAMRAAEMPAELAADLTGRRILLAEDNDLNAEIATELLKETGAEVDRAADGIQCIDMLRRSEYGYYDLILMNIQMPNLDGYRATEKIRRAGIDIPILAMTANAFAEDREKALRAGMNGHLAKPIDVPELMKALTELLG